MRRPEAGLEQVIPPNVLDQYKHYKEMGCEAVSGVACIYLEDNAYHEWVTLFYKVRGYPVHLYKYY